MRNSVRLGTLAVALLSLSACTSDRSAVPTAAPLAATNGASADLLSAATGTVSNTLTLVTGLQRSKALSSPVAVSATIGSNGGTLAIPGAGVTVVVPKGALSGNVSITMTARAGSLVAYDFAPHGITFAKPLEFTQSLAGTNASLLTANLLSLGYYSDTSLLGTSTGLVSELIGGSVNLLNWTFKSSIRHFSGYMIACRDE